MLTRRSLLLMPLAAAAAAALPLTDASAADAAAAFIEQTGKDLIGIVNGAAPAAQKQADLQKVIDRVVDVDAVAQFCLGRFWRTATANQQARYLGAFHEVLVTNITTKLGDYRGVRLSVQRGRAQDDAVIVTTVVERPNNPPVIVDWVIGQPAPAPKIIDVLAEGTSLRLTQRQDYASFLSHNNNDIDALIKAMLQQAAQAGGG